MESDMKSKTGPIAVWLGAAILTIGLMAMLETNMLSWSSDTLVSAAGILTISIFLGVTFTRTHFAVLFGFIGAATAIMSEIFKLLI